VDDGWQVEARPVPEGLEEGFEAPRYTEPEPLRTEPERDPFMVSILDKIGAAKHEELMAIFGGYPVDPSIP
jgi:hypothetical protein